MLELSWEHVCLCGWYDHNGRLHTAESALHKSVAGEIPVEVVVTGCMVPPMWYQEIPVGATLNAIPDGRDGKDYAKEINGLYAFGFYH